MTATARDVGSEGMAESVEVAPPTNPNPFGNLISPHGFLTTREAKLISLVCASIWDAQRKYVELNSSTVGEYMALSGIVVAGQLAAQLATAPADPSG